MRDVAAVVGKSAAGLLLVLPSMAQMQEQLRPGLNQRLLLGTKKIRNQIKESFLQPLQTLQLCFVSPWGRVKKTLAFSTSRPNHQQAHNLLSHVRQIQKGSSFQSKVCTRLHISNARTLCRLQHIPAARRVTYRATRQHQRYR